MVIVAASYIDGPIRMCERPETSSKITGKCPIATAWHFTVKSTIKAAAVMCGQI